MEGVSAEIAALAVQLSDTQAKIPGAQATLDAAKAALEKAQREAAIIAARLVDAEEQQATITTTIAQDTEHAQQMRAAIGQMAREAYKGGGGVSGVDVILDAQSTDDFVQRYGLMATALRTQAQILDELKAAESANRNAEARLVAVKDKIAELKAAADQKVVEADAAKAAAAAAKQALDDLLAQQVQQQAALDATKAALEAAAGARRRRGRAGAARAGAGDRGAARARRRGRPAAGPPGAIGGGLFGNPTSIDPIYVTSDYGMRMHPTLHYVRLHAGIDLRTYCNTPDLRGARRHGDVGQVAVRVRQPGDDRQRVRQRQRPVRQLQPPDQLRGQLGAARRAGAADRAVREHRHVGGLPPALRGLRERRDDGPAAAARPLMSAGFGGSAQVVSTRTRP